MTLEPRTPILVVAVLSWLLSVYLLVRLWSRHDNIAIKLGLSLLLLIPAFGPFLYFWIQSFPASNDPDLMDQHMGGDVLARWRARLERGGKLPPLVQHWKRGRRE
jgi:hypothetical protein